MADTTVCLSSLEQSLCDAIARVDVDDVAREIAAELGGTETDAAALLNTYLSESLRSLRMVGPFLDRGQRLLEVGSGIGFLAAFLARQGFDIVELEPSASGFEFIEAARQRLVPPDERPQQLEIGVDDLSPQRHGTFDLVYSVNVLEHVPDWQHALAAMMSVLEPDGIVVQSCPNYAVPYEPHFGVPLVPFAPATTERLLRRSRVESDLWRSINWISSGQVRRWARSNRVSVEFRRGQLADAVERLGSDAEFARRHAGPVGSLAAFMRWSRATALLRRLPVALSTPMQFTLRCGDTDPAPVRAVDPGR